ncbi:exodeoxyribonuclease V subunit alpha [Spiroplasma corruscae]|uniref:Exodeoxyribonuclease V subunit alpha n=1 Tax=Spiroplasma corruscae TaxID=216934 RepID=A0A222EQ50_9MOLU|nr:AAA family ATPase [Spiroplasma corruscae]ASP28373.1 exodeoxyribonuclease V subunit alpha [Spiroplasma corruscae]
MYKKYNIGELVELKKEIILLKVQELTLHFFLGNDNFDLIDRSKIEIGDNVVIEIDNYQYSQKNIIKVVNVFPKKEFDLTLFQSYYEEMKYYIGFYEISINQVIEKYEKVNTYLNIFDWFIKDSMLVNNTTTKVAKFFFNNGLSFNVFKTFLFKDKNNQDLSNINKKIKSIKDVLIVNLFNFLENENIYFEKEEFINDLYDIIRSISYQFEPVELNAIFLILNILSSNIRKNITYLSRKSFIKLMDNIDESIKEDVLSYCIDNNHIIIIDKEKFYLNIYYKFELNLSNFFKELIYINNNSDYLKSNKKLGLINELNINYIADKNSLNLKQKEALEAFIKNNILIINGGAGTGKTTLIKSIIDLLEIEGPKFKVALTSLSAMATNNIKQKFDKLNSGVMIKNIYKLLKSRGLSNFEFNESSKLEIDVLIIDECSMINLWLFYSLIRAIDLNTTKIILVGDKNQLPPIGIGNVFEDLIDSKVIPTVTLLDNERHKLSNNIITCANKIIVNKDELDEEYFNKIINEEVEGIEFHFDLEESEVLNKIVEEHENCNFLDLKSKEVQVISNLNTFKKNKIFSCENLNNKLKPLICKNYNDNLIYSLFEKILITKNLYSIKTGANFDLFNGQIGYIKEIKPYYNSIYTHEIVISLEQGDINTLYSKTKQLFFKEKDQELFLTSAFAISLHKMQGNEFNKVIYILSGINSIDNFVTKRSLYTGFTRAKEKIIIIGKKEDFFKILKNEYKKGNGNFLELLKK